MTATQTAWPPRCKWIAFVVLAVLPAGMLLSVSGVFAQGDPSAAGQAQNYQAYAQQADNLTSSSQTHSSRWPTPTLSKSALDDHAYDHAAHGFELLVSKPYVNPEFTEEMFNDLWKVWEEPARSEAEQATPDERRVLAMRRYGLTERPPGTPGGERQADMPLQYLRNGDGEWTVNCFACHGGKVAGQVIPGLPNTHFAMQTLWDDVRTLRRNRGEISLTTLAGGFLPLGHSNGTTNAVIFGVLLGAKRDQHADLDMNLPLGTLLHNDVDAPPWWHVKKKKWLYADGFVASDNHRSLLQFAMGPENSGAKLRSWDRNFQDIMAYIDSLEPPPYPFEIDRELAAQGEVAFNRVCAECHGTYGEDETYPNRNVPIDEIGTDRARFDSLTKEYREKFQQSWFADYGRSPVVTEPAGYVAPPLDGIWASAPYFHNGSVPTLWHVLHISERPTVWQRTADGYDQNRVGLEVREFAKMPDDVKNPAARRTYFDSSLFSKSAAGHDFPEQLTAEEKQAVLEYLKTL